MDPGDLQRLKAKSGNKPTRHHFVPVFLLSQWTRHDVSGARRLVQFRRVQGGKIAANSKAPDGTGYVRGLYTAPGIAGDKRQALETHFFSPLDSRAADALKILTAIGPSGLNDDMRSAWCVFLNSLRLRSPSELESIKRWMRRDWPNAAPALEAKYLAIRKENDPETLGQYLRSVDRGVIDRVTLGAIPRIVTGKIVSSHIFKMRWSILRFDERVPDLMLSDHPIISSNGIDRPEGHLVLPLGPKQLFVASNNFEIEQRIRGQNSTETARNVNKQIVEAAHQYVWASSIKPLRFVEKHMSAAASEPVGDRTPIGDQP